MATVDQVQEILKEIQVLKMLFIKAQEYASAAMMRDLEKQYLDKEVK